MGKNKTVQIRFMASLVSNPHSRLLLLTSGTYSFRLFYDAEVGEEGESESIILFCGLKI